MAVESSPLPNLLPNPVATLDAEFELEPRVALRWIETILAKHAKELAPNDAIYLLRCRAALAGTLPIKARLESEAPHGICEGLARTGAQRMVQHERTRAGTNAPRHAALPNNERLLEEFCKAVIAPTNLAGTLSNSLLLFDTFFHSLPPTWHVRLQNGAWELYDANRAARRHAFGASNKARYPPRMVLRAKGAKLSWLSQFRQTAAGAVVSVPNATSVPNAIRLAAGHRLQHVSKVAYGALPLRGIAGSNPVGLAITLGPQLFVDARAAGLFSNPTSGRAWKDFFIRSAESQSGNLAGMATGALAAVAVASLGAPAIIAVGLFFGAAGQALFNAYGFNDDAKTAALQLFDE